MARNSIYKHLRGKKRGLSAVVITVIMVALSLAAIVLVWGFVSNMIKKQIHTSESCFGTYGKVAINGEYTCYEELGENNFKLRFSMIVGDIDLEKAIVSVSSAGAVKSFEISPIPKEVPNVVMYSGPNPQNVSLPEKNGGLTYNITGFTGKIDTVKISPVVGGSLCDVSDTLSQIENCAVLA